MPRTRAARRYGVRVHTASSRRRGAVVVAVLAVLVILGLAALGDPADLAPPPEVTPTPTPAPTTPAATPTPTPTPTPTATPVADGLEVRFLDAGQGDATLLATPEATVLVDTGRHDREDVVGHLRAAGVEHLDVVVVTHPHADHLGQFDAVLEAFAVAEVWWSGATHTTRTFDRAIDAIEASDAAYGEPRAGDTTTVGDLRFEFVNPPEDADFDDLHDASLAFRVTYGEVALVFTGDAEGPTEARMVDRHGDRLAADIYQVGHHGSRTSTTQAFLDAVDPAVAVHSAGDGNQYGHPHDEPLRRLEAAGVEVYGTAAHGTIILTSDGATFAVAPE